MATPLESHWWWQVFFDECYNDQLVNAVSGIMETDTISLRHLGWGTRYLLWDRGRKRRNPWSCLCLQNVTEESDDLPAVQVGDPFQEKLLLEATLELGKTDAIVGMQDMGAAGITCSTSEMSAAGGCGMRIQLDKVPTRQANMKDWEILLSESQERMLIVVEKGKEAIVHEIYDKWDLSCQRGSNRRRLLQDGVGDTLVPMFLLPIYAGGGAPCSREYKDRLFENIKISK